MKRYGIKPRTCRTRSGFTMVEVMLSLMVFTMMALMFGAVFPFALRTAQFSNNYAQAAMIAQHKIEQLENAGYNRMDYTDLSGLGIIDSATTVSPFTFTGVDNLVAGSGTNGYFLPGSTGAMTVADYSTVNASMPAGKMDYITITITWTSYTGNTGTYSTAIVL